MPVPKLIRNIASKLPELDKIQAIWTDPEHRVALVFRVTPALAGGEQVHPGVEVSLTDGEFETPILSVRKQIAQDHFWDAKKEILTGFDYHDNVEKTPGMLEVFKGLGFGSLALNLFEREAQKAHNELAEKIKRGEISRNEQVYNIEVIPSRSAEDHELYTKRDYQRPADPEHETDEYRNRKEKLYLTLPSLDRVRDSGLIQNPKKLEKFTVPIRMGRVYYPSFHGKDVKWLLHAESNYPFTPEHKARVERMSGYLSQRRGAENLK
jgi:hypothetical protein